MKLLSALGGPNREQKQTVRECGVFQKAMRSSALNRIRYSKNMEFYVPKASHSFTNGNTILSADLHGMNVWHRAPPHAEDSADQNGFFPTSIICFATSLRSAAVFRLLLLVKRLAPISMARCSSPSAKLFTASFADL